MASLEPGAPSTAWKLRAAWGLWCLGCAPWALSGNSQLLWSALLALCILLLWRLGGFLVHAGVPLGTALCAYLGCAAQETGPLMMAVAAVSSLTAALLAQPRGLRATGVVAAWVPLAVVACVLRASPWQGESHRFLSLSVGLGFGLSVFLAGRCLFSCGVSTRAVCASALCCCVVAGGRQRLQTPHWEWALPTWRAAAHALEQAPEDETFPTDETLLGLQALRAVGARDAAFAWIGLALAQNATPQLLQSHCPRLGWRGPLAPRWQRLVRLGDAACTALTLWPEDGANRLASSSNPALQRLRGDLLMEAGRLRLAQAAYAAAAASGDSYARDNERHSLMVRGRPVAAVAQTWNDYNRMLDFRGLTPPERVGLVTLGWAESLRSVYDTQLKRRVLITTSPASNDVTVSVPLPPGAGAPREMELQIKARGRLEITFIAANGTSHTLSCSAHTLDEKACSGIFGTAVVQPKVTGTLQAILLQGAFAVARVQLMPS